MIQLHVRGSPAVAHYRWFTHPDERALYLEADHERQGRQRVANLRAVLSRTQDSRATAIVDELRRSSPEFVRVWAQHDVARPASGHKKTIVHPIVGNFQLDCQTLFSENRAHLLLVLIAPAGSESEEKLRQLLGGSSS